MILTTYLRVGKFTVHFFFRFGQINIVKTFFRIYLLFCDYFIEIKVFNTYKE